ncbi:hypothetical protein [Azospirillum rugosum]|uniref:GNAT family N-acetyltransferase n=1 Tax=Azospirillum rugosum TaxID=416170 RepID=A0ABS4SL61_9PROT|nr:hypothetical protein [Azospirillum rugosum]MBP2293309.1 hypothetical protein [Azospirillum rugosum]
MTRTVAPLTEADVPSLAELLAANGLATDDVTAPGRRFWRVTDEKGLIGCCPPRDLVPAGEPTARRLTESNTP